jgi:hypothetical protein
MELAFNLIQGYTAQLWRLGHRPRDTEGCPRAAPRTLTPLLVPRTSRSAPSVVC